jgi:hypothetical protein
MQSSKDTINGVVVLVGNPSDGFIPYGPYLDFDAAIDAWEGEECWIMELHSDRETIKVMDCDRSECRHCRSVEREARKAHR